jgi:hypothetical protein
MKIEKIEHSFYQSGVVDRWRYTYSNENGSISLIKFRKDYYEQPWEILFEGNPERFRTRKEAEARIYEILNHRKGFFESIGSWALEFINKLIS